MNDINVLKQLLIELKFNNFIRNSNSVYYLIRKDHCYEFYTMYNLMTLTNCHVGYNYKYLVNDTFRSNKTFVEIQTKDIDKVYKFLLKLFKNEVRLLKLKKVYYEL